MLACLSRSMLSCKTRLKREREERECQVQRNEIEWKNLDALYGKVFLCVRSPTVASSLTETMLMRNTVGKIDGALSLGGADYFPSILRCQKL